MGTFKVTWNSPDSSDSSIREEIVEEALTMAHAAWIAAERAFNSGQPSSGQLLDVERLS